jgi:RNA polymerase sigma factor (TIGR02999 family)
MTNQGPSDITAVLAGVADGDNDAAARLLPMVYDELRKLAALRMAKTPPGNTLQPTALVHEAYLRVVGDSDSNFNTRKHFFFAAARAMRDILVEQYRRKSRLKHGGGQKRLELADVGIVVEPPAEDMEALNEVITKLEEADPKTAQTVLLRYFAGLTIEETAEVLKVSVATVNRQWKYARAWLRTELERHDSTS